MKNLRAGGGARSVSALDSLARGGHLRECPASRIETSYGRTALTVRNLPALLVPRSIAVLGASNRRDSVGGVLFRNLLLGEYDGVVHPVNPKYESVQGVRAYGSVLELEAAPDLGVVCTPPATVPGIISELASVGARAAVVITAGLSGEAEREVL